MFFGEIDAFEKYIKSVHERYDKECIINEEADIFIRTD